MKGSTPTLELIVIKKGEGSDILSLQLPKGKKTGRDFRFEEINLEVTTNEEMMLPQRRMRGRLQWSTESYTINFEEYGKGEKKNREVSRTTHMRCVLRKDGSYHISIGTAMRSKSEKQELVAELRNILEAIEKDIEKLRRQDAAKLRQQRHNNETKEGEE